MDVLKSLAWWAVVLAIVAQWCSYGGNGYVIQRLVGLFNQRLALLRCVEIVMASFSLGLIWGGQVTYSGAAYRWLRAAGVSSEAALLTGILPALINIATITAVLLLGLLYLLAGHQLSPALTTVFVVAFALIFCTGVIIWLGLHYRLFLRLRYGLPHSVCLSCFGHTCEEEPDADGVTVCGWRKILRVSDLDVKAFDSTIQVVHDSGNSSEEASD